MSSDRLLPLLLLCAACTSEVPPTALHADYQGTTPAPLGCVPNLDGKIEASELPVAIGVPENFLVSPPGATRAIDPVGTTNAQGQRVWDWSIDEASDQLATIEASALSGKWYASSFPSGQFVTPVDPGDTVEAVYSLDQNALWLWGVASAQQSPPAGETLLPYTNPVPAFQLPLAKGEQWDAIGEVANGTFDGLPYAGVDSYSFAVEDEGILVLPELTFTQALSVHSTLTTTPVVGSPVTTRQISFVFECFGEVARATSQPGETADDFTTAAQVRRLSLERR